MSIPVQPPVRAIVDRDAQDKMLVADDVFSGVVRLPDTACPLYVELYMCEDGTLEITVEVDFIVDDEEGP